MIVNKIQQHAFEAQHFQDNVAVVVDRLASYLSDRSVRGLHVQHPEALRRAALDVMTDEHTTFPEFQKERLERIVDLFIASGIQVHSPGSMGRQFSGIVPLSAVMDLVGSIVNQPASFYEAGQLPSVVERIMADELNRFIGYAPDTFAMVTTSGASLANLTAILSARNLAFPELWEKGFSCVTPGNRPAVAVSEDVHYSICRAMGIMGIGSDQVIRLPVDERRRIKMDQVRPALEAAEKQGLKIFCLVASAGSTSVGAIDPLDELADLSEELGIWLHVDGAHGASLLVSDPHRSKLKGLARADSFAWDAHKVMFVSAACTFLFYKDKTKSRSAFQQSASYVFEKEEDIYTAYDSAEMNFECTKRPMVMGIWTAWALYGRALFAEKIDYLCGLTSDFYDLLCAQPDFTALHQPEINIICFRYTPDVMDDETLSELQLMIRNTVKSEGLFFISKVELNGINALRCVFMNHLIRVEHYSALLDHIRDVGQRFIAKGTDEER